MLIEHIEALGNIVTALRLISNDHVWIRLSADKTKLIIYTQLEQHEFDTEEEAAIFMLDRLIIATNNQRAWINRQKEVT